MSDNSNKPIHRLRYGNVVATVWANNSHAGYFYDTTVHRVYKEGDQWGDSSSFEDRDLPNLGKGGRGRTHVDSPAEESAVRVTGTNGS